MKKITKKIAFLILHYNTIDDTKKCVTSIEKNVAKDDYIIVIVDNCSPNNSGEKLKKIYKDKVNVKLIFSEKNLGFANGNNLGFRYIKENYNVDFIAMINNDTYLLHNDFLKVVEKEYEKSKFAVLGPKILLPNNKITPIQQNLITLKEIKARKKRYIAMYICNLLYIQFLYDLIKKWYLKLNPTKKSNLYSEQNVNIRQENIVLHGAFLIFSKVYIDKFDGLDSRTYMYLEEKVLAVRLKKYNLKSVYNPRLEVFHNEDSATNSVKRNKREKNLFIYKNAYNSAKILIKELESLGNYD